MKKNLIPLTIVCLIAAGIGACKKTGEHEVLNLTTDENFDEGLALYQRTLAFNDLLKSDLKSGAVLSFDSAQWYTEAYYNVFHGSPEHEAESYRIDSLTYSLPVNNTGTVSMEDLATLIETIEADVASVTQNGDVVVWGDIYFNETDGVGDNVILYTGVGTGIASTVKPSMWFGNECWYWGHTLGPCDGSPMVYSDAGEEMEKKAPFHLPVTACYKGQLIVTSVDSLNKFFTGLNHPDSVYYLWKPGPYDPPCLCQQELNRWLASSIRLVGSFIVNNSYILAKGRSVDYFTFSRQKDMGNVEAYEYYHGIDIWYYDSYYCLPTGNQY